MPRRCAGDQYPDDTGNVWSVCRRGDANALGKLLDRGTDPDLKNKTGWTPVMAAAAGDHGHVLDVLRRAGADVGAVDNGGRNAGHHAAANGAAAALRWLARNGGEKLLTARDAKGIAPWDVAKGPACKALLEKYQPTDGGGDDAVAEGKPAWEGRRAHGARRRPFSGKEKKQQLQQKRAAKRGDGDTVAKAGGTAPPLGLVSTFGETGESTRFHTLIKRESDESLARRRADAERRLEGRALTARADEPPPPYPSAWLAEARGGAAPLSMPPAPDFDAPPGPDRDAAEAEAVATWADAQPQDEDAAPFERNPRVWRQLWLLLRRADVVVVCTPCALALLHLPHPALAVLDVPVIVALTKADQLPKPVREAWASDLQRRFPNVHAVVPVSSDGRAANVAKRGSSARWTGHEDDGIARLWDVLMDLAVDPRGGDGVATLGALLDRGAADDVRARGVEGEVLAADAPAVEPDGTSGEDGAGSDSDDRSGADDSGGESGGDDAPSTGTFDPGDRWRAAAAWRSARRRGDRRGARASRAYAAIGMIGEPNCGKSALVNRLLGASVAGVSTTPGRTQRLQTYFLSPHVALLDCPGLVFPKQGVSRALAVVIGNLPIAQTREPYSAVRELCHWVGHEALLQAFPGLPEDARLPDRKGAKKGRGDDACSADASDAGLPPSPFRLCEQLAVLWNFWTPKAARPDAARAANLLLRLALRGSPLHVAFAPPL